jgi:lipoprotein-anchoring transpeptidase ErfK/SrfK
MRILYILGVTLLSFSLLVGGWIFMTQGSLADSGVPYQYEITNRSQDITLKEGNLGLLVASLKNTGSAIWNASEVELHAIYLDKTDERDSYFATNEWLGESVIRSNAPLDGKTSVVRPGQTINMYIPIQVPETAHEAIYKEDFKLYIGNTPMEGPILNWLIQVGDNVTYQSTSQEHIQIWLDTQRLWVVENNVVTMNVPVSSGRTGYWTPKGNYKIMNHIDTAYSSPYNLWMDYWMALESDTTGFRGYGLHRLPYWKVAQGNRIDGEVVDGRLYTDGKLYEDYAHLGKPMSHGCVRLGLVASEILYNWAKNGTEVIIS